jgi:hypothetical protein
LIGEAHSSEALPVFCEALASQRVATKIGLRRDPAFDDQGEDGVDWAFNDRS